MDAQLAVEENGPDVGRGHQVVEVGIGPAQLFHVALQLVVDRGQLFVDRLQFLLARLQFLGRGTHLLVHRLELFVRRFQLFVGRFVLLDRGAELLLQGIDLLARFAADRVVRDRRRRRDAAPASPSFWKRTRKNPLASSLDCIGRTSSVITSLLPSNCTRCRRAGDAFLAFARRWKSAVRNSICSAGLITFVMFAVGSPATKCR